MFLYQFAWGHQPHYVVAMGYGQAAELIRAKGYSYPKSIECLGNYVILPPCDCDEEPEAP